MKHDYEEIWTTLNDRISELETERARLAKALGKALACAPLEYSEPILKVLAKTVGTVTEADIDALFTELKAQQERHSVASPPDNRASWEDWLAKECRITIRRGRAGWYWTKDVGNAGVSSGGFDTYPAVLEAAKKEATDAQKTAQDSVA